LLSSSEVPQVYQVPQVCQEVLLFVEFFKLITFIQFGGVRRVSLVSMFIAVVGCDSFFGGRVLVSWWEILRMMVFWWFHRENFVGFCSSLALAWAVGALFYRVQSY